MSRNMNVTKSKLAIELSKMQGFAKPKIQWEQYQLDPETAAEILWHAYLREDIKGKVIADLGAGPGMLTRGCLLLGAKKIYAVDKDKEALQQAKLNIKSEKVRFINKDVKEFTKRVHTVIQNPPFGTKIKHADKLFLEQAMHIAEKVYSIHKLTSKKFVQALAKDHGFEVEDILPINMPLKKSYAFHRKPQKMVQLGCWILKQKA